MREVVIQEGMYYSLADEKAFFDRLTSLRCVAGVRGAPDGLHINLSRRPSDTQLRELIALLYRYDLDMKPLAELRTEHNAPWYADPKAFWHAAVFGRGKCRHQK